jgi:hypothetical protein
MQEAMMLPRIDFQNSYGGTVSFEENQREGGANVFISAGGSGYLWQALSAEEAAKLRDWLICYFPPSPANSLP